MYKIWLLMMTGNGFPVGLHPYCRLRRPNKKQAVRQNSPLLFFHFFYVFSLRGLALYAHACGKNVGLYLGTRQGPAEATET